MKREYKSSQEAEIVLARREAGERITPITRMEEFIKMNLCFFLHPQGEMAIFPKPLKICVIRSKNGVLLGFGLCSIYEKEMDLQ